MSNFGGFCPPKTFVLCFDGTGNKFSGTESDSNVLKIFRMLDQSRGDQFHYYQPGMGTYVTTSTTLSNTGFISKLKRSYLKAKDSAIGTSFADHVMGGYRFLMRYYAPGDEIYFFGFSRGAYIARFLAEMLDYIGLLTTGNEELVRFAWKTFSKWQQRTYDSKEGREQRRELFDFMKAFRETFSRPVKRIRFLGLFDTVNSVPMFESPWMERSKSPYTARSSAKVIRHAVGIDERRAKFRQNLISETRNCHEKHHGLPYPWRLAKYRNAGLRGVEFDSASNEKDQPDTTTNGDEVQYRNNLGVHDENTKRYWNNAARLSVAPLDSKGDNVSLADSCHSHLSLHIPSTSGRFDGDDDGPQDIEELWFPGGHADIGGGWDLMPEEMWPLSHAPLVWMVHEAQKAGLRFDERKLKQFECNEQYSGDISPIKRSFRKPILSGLRRGKSASGSQYPPSHGPVTEKNGRHGGKETASQNFNAALQFSCANGCLHDSLSFGSEMSPFSVTMWRIMEYLPFRRMDLQPDGTWKPVRWPLPCGEVRDIPDNANIHVSAIRRMKANKDYRPGNLIMGGGGRGCRKAPEHMGIGEWTILKNEGDPIRETYVRREATGPATPTTQDKQRNGT